MYRTQGTVGEEVHVVEAYLKAAKPPMAMGTLAKLSNVFGAKKMKNMSELTMERAAGAAPLGAGATLAWLNPYRWLSVRYERRADLHEEFLYLG